MLTLSRVKLLGPRFPQSSFRHPLRPLPVELPFQHPLAVLLESGGAGGLIEATTPTHRSALPAARKKRGNVSLRRVPTVCATCTATPLGAPPADALFLFCRQVNEQLVCVSVTLTLSL